MELRNANCIVTGASRGIGAFLCRSLASRGANLALAARSAEELEKVAEGVRNLGVRAVVIPTDVSRRDDLVTLVEKAGADLGPIDVLINNAGVEKYGDFHQADPDLIEKVTRVNYIAPVTLARLVLPQMIERRRGHIVNISSVAGKTAVPYNVIYSGSKHALVGFSWSLREEVKPFGVGVSVVCPGFVSEAGMFADWSQGRKPPGLANMVSPQKVADKTIEAIEKDKAEVIVAGGLMKIVDVFHALSPAFTTNIARRSGAYRFLSSAKDSSFRE
jgi:short-subunit dehydrogenase